MSAYRDRYRLPISGYRSQPVSNRSSLYLPSDYTVSNVSDDLSDFDRQFKKLLERTEKFTNRVEKLQSNATNIKKGFRRIDNTVTGIRSHRDVIGTTFDNIETRLDVNDAPTTEEEWRRYVDGGILIEKAVELLRSRFRYPKQTFEYSPPERSPYSFEVSSNTSLVSNPPSPRDREGNRIRDLGSDVKSVYPVNDDSAETGSTLLKRTRDKKDNKLAVLSEEPETDQNLNQSKLEENKKNKSNDNFRSSRLFNEDDGSTSKLSPIFTIGDGKENNDVDEVTSQPRRQSFLKTLISNKKKNRPTSMIEKPSTEYIPESRTKRNTTKTLHENNAIEHRRNLLKAKSAHSDLDNIAQDITSSFQSSGNSSANTSQTLFHDEKTSNKPSIKKRGSSSSFHEYNPSNRIPLKERLRLKREAENKNNLPEHSELDITPVVPNTPLAQRASKLLKSKEKEREREKEKEESLSLKSRFLRRFRSHKTENHDKHNDGENISTRRRTRKRSDDGSEADLSALIHKKRQSVSEDQQSRNNSSSKEERLRRSSSSDLKRSRKSSSSKVGEESTTEIRQRRRKSRPISDDEADDVFNKPTNKFSDITCSLRDKQVTSTPRREDSLDDSRCASRTVVRRRKSRPRTDSEESNIQDETNSNQSEEGQSGLSDIRNYEADQVRQRNKTESEPELNLKDSLLIHEEEIIPVASKREERIIEFRTPQESREEVSEDELQVDIATGSTVPDNIFDILTKNHRQISEEEIPTVQVSSKVIVDDDAFERVYQMSPLKDKTTFFSEDIIAEANYNTKLRNNSNIETVPSWNKETSGSNLSLTKTSQIHSAISNSPHQIHSTINEPEVSLPPQVRATVPMMKRSSIDDMLVEFDKINDEMYTSLLDLAKPETVCETKVDTTLSTDIKASIIPSDINKHSDGGTPSDSIENKEHGDSYCDTNNEKSSPEYNVKVQAHSTILDSNDVAFITFAKYAGRNISEITGTSFDNDVVTNASLIESNTIEHEGCHDNVTTQSSVLRNDVVQNQDGIIANILTDVTQISMTNKEGNLPDKLNEETDKQITTTQTGTDKPITNTQTETAKPITNTQAETAKPITNTQTETAEPITNTQTGSAKPITTTQTETAVPITTMQTERKPVDQPLTTVQDTNITPVGHLLTNLVDINTSVVEKRSTTVDDSIIPVAQHPTTVIDTNISIVEGTVGNTSITTPDENITTVGDTVLIAKLSINLEGTNTNLTEKLSINVIESNVSAVAKLPVTVEYPNKTLTEKVPITVIESNSTENVPITAIESNVPAVAKLPVTVETIKIETSNTILVEKLPTTLVESNVLAAAKLPVTLENSNTILVEKLPTTLANTNTENIITENQMFEQSPSKLDVSIESPLPTPKKRLSYREKREAHMKLLQGQNNLSDSLLSLSEIDTTVNEDINNTEKTSETTIKCATNSENSCEVNNTSLENDENREFDGIVAKTKMIVENIDVKSGTIVENDDVKYDAMLENNDVNIETIVQSSGNKVIVKNNDVKVDVIEKNNDAVIDSTLNVTCDVVRETTNSITSQMGDDGNSSYIENTPVGVNVVSDTTISLPSECDVTVIPAFEQPMSKYAPKQDYVDVTMISDLKNENHVATVINNNLQSTSNVKQTLDTSLTNEDHVGVEINNRLTNEGHVERIIITEEIVVTEYQAEPRNNPVTRHDVINEVKSLESDVIEVQASGDVMEGQEFCRPKLEKQISIKEYRRRKMERGMSETSCSDDSMFERSDVEKSTVSSLADVSDVSDDNRCRNKRYSHSRKDLENIGRTSESSSESETSVSSERLQTNKYRLIASGFNHNGNLVTLSEPNDIIPRSSQQYRRNSSSDVQQFRRNSSSETLTLMERRKRYNIKRFIHRSLDQF